MITAFRKFFSDPRIALTEIDEELIQGLMNVFPISSAEAERGSSKMNLICSKMRSLMTIKHLSSLMFICINGPPGHLCCSSQMLHQNGFRNIKVQVTIEQGSACIHQSVI